MTSPAPATEYLREPQNEWVKRLRREIIEPRRAHVVDRPLLQSIIKGEASRETVVDFLSGILWTVVPFPEYIAALASKCPTYDWEIKSRLLENAYSERDHPFMLANAIRALGGNPDPIVNGPADAWQPIPKRIEQRRFKEYCLYERPWIEGIACIEVGVETMVPYIVGPVGRAMEEHYGLRGEELIWFEIHGGEVEQEHGNDGLLVLDRYVPDSDRETAQRCWDIVHEITVEFMPAPVTA